MSQTMDIRFPAEWENQSAVQLTWPHKNSDWAEDLEQIEKVFVHLVQAITRFQKVIIVCQSQRHVQSLLSALPQGQIVYAEILSNDTWARDHGAITIFKEKKPRLLDFQFNGWGKKYNSKLDNAISKALYNREIFSEEVTLQTIPMVLEGGALETDGQGTLLTTEKCLLNENRNGLSKAATEIKLKEYLGIQRFLWLSHGQLSGDDTDGHIDTLARFVNPETIVYCKTEDRQHPDFHSLQAMEAELQAFKDANRKYYKLIPLPMPKVCRSAEGELLPATYANFLIINHAILVPLYDCEADEQALGILSKCFPKREIIGVNCKSIINQFGSLHCLTMQYPRYVVK